MPIVTGKPASAEQLLRKITKIQQDRPQGFRQPRKDGGGCFTLLERLSLETGMVSFADLQPTPSDRMLKKRRLRRVFRAIMTRQRELGGKISFAQCNQVRREVLEAEESA